MWAVLGAGNGYTAEVVDEAVTDGTKVAFHLAAARAALERGDSLAFENILLTLDGGGLRAVNASGANLGGHQSFWFSWSPFYPNTLLWPH